MNKVKLVDICTPKQWKTIPTSELLNKGYPVYGANGIIGYYDKYNHENSVVAITCRGATCGSVHITVPNAYITGNAMCLDDLREDIEPYYLYYCLLHFDFQSVISGSAQPQITRQGLEKVLIPICSRERQVSIANRLKKTENIIAKRKEELATLDTLVKSRFIEMFGDKTKSKFPVNKIGTVAKLQGGYAFKSKDYVDDGVPLVQIANVSKSILNWEIENYVPICYLKKYEEFSLSSGDIVMAMTRPVIKSVDAVKVAAVKDDDIPCLLNQRVGRFKIEHDKLNPLYLMTICHMSAFKEYVELMSGNSLQPNISSKQVEDYEIIIPPIALQNQFAAFVEQVDKSKSVLQKLLEKQELLRAALMQEYFG